MADYDLYSNVKPVGGTSAEVVMDGTTYTAVIDTFDWKSLCFLANIHADAYYTDIDWTVADSDDGATFSAVDGSLLLNRNPSDGATTSRAFHIGYIGKKRYVKAALDVDGTTAVAVAPVIGSEITLTSLTSSSTTATAVKAGHGLVVGQYVTISGAEQTEYNVRARVATVADSSHFTYTFAGSSSSPATGTITATPEANWTNDEGADPPGSITAGVDALTGSYTLTVSHITSASTAYRLTKGSGNTGNGTVAVASISAAYANAIFNETLVAKCTTAASNAGVFTVYRADGTTVCTVTVGAGATNIQPDGSHTAFTLTIADGSSDWAANDVIEITVTDLGKTRYVLTDPDGAVVGYPLSGVAFTSTHLNLTVPDSTVAVSDATAETAIAVTHGLAKGQIMALLSNPLSGPLFSSSIEV